MKKLDAVNDKLLRVFRDKAAAKGFTVKTKANSKRSLSGGESERASTSTSYRSVQYNE